MPNVVSKLLPHVSMVAGPFAGAVHEYQTELIGSDPLVFGGSPLSDVASILEPTTLPAEPETLSAFEKSSLEGPEDEGPPNAPRPFGVPIPVGRSYPVSALH